MCRYSLIPVITLKLRSRSVVKERHVTKQQREYAINILQNLQTPPIGLIRLFSGNAAVATAVNKHHVVIALKTVISAHPVVYLFFFSFCFFYRYSIYRITNRISNTTKLQMSLVNLPKESAIPGVIAQFDHRVCFSNRLSGKPSINQTWRQLVCKRSHHDHHWTSVIT